MTLNRILAISAVGVFATGALIAQATGSFGLHRGGFGNPERRVEMLANRLNLTEAQKETAKALFGEARQQSETIVSELKQTHEDLAAAVKAGKGDAELTELANKQGALMGRITAIHARAFSRLYAQLTPEQKIEADRLHDRMKQHFGRGAKSGG